MANREARAIRSRRKSALTRIADWWANTRRSETRRLSAQYERNTITVKEEQEKLRVFQSMTNWQFNQFHRKHGGKKIASVPIEELKHFAELPHCKKVKANV